MHRMALALLLVGALEAAAAPVTLEEAVSLFEAGQYAQARDALLPIVEKEAPEQRDKARLYLAASYHALGNDPIALEHLLELARSRPDLEVSPVLFVPEFVELAHQAEAMAAEVRARQARLADPTAEPTPPPVPPEAPSQRPAARVESPAGPPAAPTVLPWALRVGARGLVELEGTRSVGAVVHALGSVGAFEGGVRSVLGARPTVGAELGWALPIVSVARVGLRGTYFPALGGGGGGPFAGVRLPVGGRLSLGVELGLEYFFLPREYEPIALTLSAGVDYGLVEVRR